MPSHSRTVCRKLECRPVGQYDTCPTRRRFHGPQRASIVRLLAGTGGYTDSPSDQDAGPFETFSPGILETERADTIAIERNPAPFDERCNQCALSQSGSGRCCVAVNERLPLPCSLLVMAHSRDVQSWS